MKSLKKIEDFVLEEKIGEGQFGTVYRARNTKTKNVFAIKVISKSLFANNKLMRRQLKRETVIMNSTCHPNLMHLHRSFETGRNYYLVLDLCEGGDLENFLIKHKIKRFSESEAISILAQILQGFQELRKQNVMHRDLKLENIFISGEKVVLGDFGAAKIVKEMTSTTVGTPLNMAPEVMAGEDYNHKSDLWSIGIIFYRLLVGKAPFFALSIGQLKHKALTQSGQNLNFKKQNHFCEKVKNLLKRLLEPNPKKRISWEEFFNHEIFSKDHKKYCDHIRKNKEIPFLKKFLIKKYDSPISKKNKFINFQENEKFKSTYNTAPNTNSKNKKNKFIFNEAMENNQIINKVFNNSNNSLNSLNLTSIDSKNRKNKKEKIKNAFMSNQEISKHQSFK